MMDEASTCSGLCLDNRKFFKHVLDLDASPICLYFMSGFVFNMSSSIFVVQTVISTLGHQD